MTLVWKARNPWRLTTEEKKEIARRYKCTKVSMRELAAEYGLCSHAAVASIIKKRKRKSKR